MRRNSLASSRSFVSCSDPREHRVFFGALDREKLSFSERMIVKAVKAPDGDFRDWDAINGWADEIADELR